MPQIGACSNVRNHWEKQLFAAVKKCTNVYILFILGSFAPSKRCHRKLSHSLIVHAKMCPYNKIATVHFTDSHLLLHLLVVLLIVLEVTVVVICIVHAEKNQVCGWVFLQQLKLG